MKLLKKEVRRAICALLIAAMVCSDAGLTVYAAEPEIFEETVGEAAALAGEEQTEEPATDFRLEESPAGDSQAEEPSTGDSKPEEDLPGSGETEGTSSEDGEQKDTSLEETPKGEETEGDSGKEGDKTGAEEEKPVKDDAALEENTDTEDTENPGDASAEESVSENDVKAVEEDSVTAVKAAGNNIASGEYKENGNDITWVIDADGKLTVEGTGDFSGDHGYNRAPWYSHRIYIKSAEVNVIGMKDASYMFGFCENLEEVDLSRFNTCSVIVMEAMFFRCSNLANLDVSSFDTSNAVYMDMMFEGCNKLISLDISNFDTSNVENMSEMFEGCSNLVSLNVSSFDTSNVIDMSRMFFNCSDLTILDVGGFNTSKVTEMASMFYDCNSLASLNVSGFDTSKVIEMTSMFYNCSSLTSLDVSGFVTSNVTNMFGMFSGCSSLKNLNVSNFATGNVTNMNEMFLGCKGLSSLDVSNFDTSNVTGMGGMFSGCSGLVNLDVSGFATGNVSTMNEMFCSCSGLINLDVGSFDTNNVTMMTSMFSGCSSLMSLDVSSFDTSSVAYIDRMFSGCVSLVSLDLSGFDTGNVMGVGGMFSGCSNLTSLDLSGLNATGVVYIDFMLDGCNNLVTIHTPYNLSLWAGLPAEPEDIWYRQDGTIITGLPQNLNHSITIVKNTVLKAEKEKTHYLCGDTINLDDLTVTYYTDDSTINIVDCSEYTTNVGDIDTAVEGKQTLTITYRDGGNVFTASIELTVSRLALNADNVEITFADADGLVYDGAPKTPEVTVVCTISGNTIDDGSVSENSLSRESVSDNSVSGNSVTMEKDKDYTVTYENNINAFEDGEALATVQNAPRVVITGQNRYHGTVSKAFIIRKAASPQVEECLETKDYNVGQSGCTLDLSGYFADYQKTGYTVGKPAEDDTVAGSVIAGQPSIDEKGILTYQTVAGTRGDFAVIPVTVSFVNYKDGVINVKIMLGNGRVEDVAAPVSNPESGRQLTAGSKVALTCETAGAEIYYTTGASQKELADPVKEGIRYTEPITIDSDIYIRTVARKGGNQSRTVTFHYTVLAVTDQVMKPYADPIQGAVDKGTKIALLCNTPDAVIYYTTGGNADVLGIVPVDEAHKYTQPIEITRDTAVKAVARKEGMKDSDAAVFVYRVNTVINAPVADPETGTEVEQGSYISLTADSDANIYYTTDTSAPAVSGTAKLYESRIRVADDAGSVIVIRAVAEKKGIYSETVTFTYTVSENKAKGLQVMLAGSEEFIYTGRSITPAIIVTNNGEELTEGKDYTVRYSNNVKAAKKDARKAPKITVTGKGNLTKSRSITFTIQPKDIGDEEEVVGGSIVAVSGKTASPILFYGGVKLTTKDFTNPDTKKRYSEDSTVTITGKGNFTGTRDIDVTVVSKTDMKKFTVVIDNKALRDEPLVYDGDAKTLDGYFNVFDTKDKKTPLEEYSDYMVIYPENNVDAGKVKFTVLGLGEYYGTVTKSYTIKSRVVKKAEDGDMQVNVDDGDSYPFRNGGVTIPDLAVTCDGDLLVPGKDYKVAYSSNRKICTNNNAKCTISFRGNYKGSKALVRKFNITPAVLDDVDQINGVVSVAVGDKVYTGKRGAYKSTPYVTADGVLLKSSDYKVSYYKDQDMEQKIDGKTASSSVDLTNMDRQTVYVKIEGKGNYKGILTAEYNVYKRIEEDIDLSRAKVTFTGGNKVEYTGEGVGPAVEIRYKSGREWKKVDDNDIGTSVKVTYINNVNKGKATVMINGSGGKYVGSKTAVFNIVPKSIK